MCTRPFTSLDWDSWHIWGFWRLKTKTEHLTHSTSSKHDWHTLRKLLKLSRIDFPGSAGAKDPASQCTRHSRDGFDSWVGKIAWKREWQPTSVFLSGEFHGQRSLAGYSPWGYKESDRIETWACRAPQRWECLLSNKKIKDFQVSKKQKKKNQDIN